jgi:hypothetical protein
MAGGPRLGGEHGAVLLCALMVTMLLAALGGALAVLVWSETMTSANHRTAQETFYAADSGLDFVASELRRLGDWSALLLTPPGNTTSMLDDGTATPRAPDGTPLDLAQLTRAVQADSETRFGAIGANRDTPVWRLYAHGALDRLLPSDGAASPAYVVAWIADDVEDGDGDAAHDANGVIVIRSVAFGFRSGRRTLEATLARRTGGAEGTQAPVRLISWREVR